MKTKTMPDALASSAALIILWSVLAACAAISPASIASGLDACLRSRTAFAPHLALACECLTRAERDCRRAGLDPKCFADGFHDADRDGWTIAACTARRTP